MQQFRGRFYQNEQTSILNPDPNSHQPYTTYLFLGNVAAADLLTGFAVIYGQYAPREIRGEDNCAILIA
ncbi:hypothetical protein pipiens_016653 [Culex pipiens pipiens]|uniref:Uncharacterized protein n=1 Tax=Culex pipiens pipiens TaxID=38569 RepID=A0ABD1CL77_CULPP